MLTSQEGCFLVKMWASRKQRRKWRRRLRKGGRERERERKREPDSCINELCSSWRPRVLPHCCADPMHSRWTQGLKVELCVCALVSIDPYLLASVIKFSLCVFVCDCVCVHITSPPTEHFFYPVSSQVSVAEIQVGRVTIFRLCVKTTYHMSGV